MISVIAPCLNEEKNLLTFLDSLLLQTFKDFELIIIDGGSTDRSLWIISHYFDMFAHLGITMKALIDPRRNFGYIRNLGASHAEGEIMLHVNTDNYLEPKLLEKIDKYYREHPETLSVSGRVYPLGTNIIAHLSYQIFDFLRFAFTCGPFPIKKYRPSGNFMSFKSWVWKKIGGYPEVPVNEDGLMGEKIEEYIKSHRLPHKAVVFNLHLYVGHHVKKFEEMGGLRALLFYLYTLGNLFPMLNPFLKSIKNFASLVFEGETPKRLGVKMLLRSFWDWL